MSAISASEYETRIRQLEKLNATLAAEIDRMRPVVEATVRQVRRTGSLFSWSDLKQAVDIYEGTTTNGPR